MCLNPKKILNKGYRPLDIRTSQYIYVDCNKCSECRRDRANQYAFRLQQEYQNNSNSLTLYVTLTYNDDYLPSIDYFDEDGNIKHLSCWNRQHIQRMHKRVRRKLQYYYGIDSDSFKFLCASERGSDDLYIDWHGKVRQATERPHYHLMYIVYNCLDIVPLRPLPERFFDWCKRNSHQVSFRAFFQYLLDSEWFYGHVEDLEVTRTPSSCIRYISKYIMKDYGEKMFDIPLNSIISLNDKDFRDRFKIFSRLVDRINSGEYHLAKKAPKPIDFSSLLPRSFSSINLGMSLFSNLDADETIEKVTNLALIDQSCVVSGSQHSSSINLPYYYYKKFFKGSYKLPLGIDYDFHDGRKLRRCSTFSPEGDKIGHYVQRWNNMEGFFTTWVPKVFSKSFYTPLGEKVRFGLFKKKIDSSVATIHRCLSNPIYYTSLLGYFDKVPKHIFDGLCNFFHSPSSFRSALGAFASMSDYNISSLVKKYYHLSYEELKHVSGKFKCLTIIFESVRLCKSILNYFKDALYQRMYKDHLGFVALNNPQLLIKTYLSYE